MQQKKQKTVFEENWYQKKRSTLSVPKKSVKLLITSIKLYRLDIENRKKIFEESGLKNVSIFQSYEVIDQELECLEKYLEHKLELENANNRD